MTTLSEQLTRACEDLCRVQHEDGSFTAGNNGPYNDLETPVRNTCHATVLLSKEYKKNPSGLLENAIRKAINYLDSQRQASGYYIMRESSRKDITNGVIGQAWVIEAYVEAYESLSHHAWLNTAVELALLHCWDSNVAAWRCVDQNGGTGSVDGTFNHQLWFAAAVSMTNNKELLAMAAAFLDLNAKKLELYSDGVIYHLSRIGTYSDALRHKNLWRVKYLYIQLKRPIDMFKLYKKSVGYHAFNLYAFALLKDRLPQHTFWSSKTMKNILETTLRPRFYKILKESIYGLAYNPSGIELAYVGEKFDMGIDYSTTWINHQLAETRTGGGRHLLTRGSHDVETSKNRLYEASRLDRVYNL